MAASCLHPRIFLRRASGSTEDGFNVCLMARERRRTPPLVSAIFAMPAFRRGFTCPAGSPGRCGCPVSYTSGRPPATLSTAAPDRLVQASQSSTLVHAHAGGTTDTIEQSLPPHVSRDRRSLHFSLHSSFNCQFIATRSRVSHAGKQSTRSRRARASDPASIARVHDLPIRRAPPIIRLKPPYSPPAPFPCGNLCGFIASNTYILRIINKLQCDSSPPPAETSPGTDGARTFSARPGCGAGAGRAAGRRWTGKQGNCPGYEPDAGKSARWRSRFLARGISALEKDARRPGRTPNNVRYFSHIRFEFYAW